MSVFMHKDDLIESNIFTSNILNQLFLMMILTQLMVFVAMCLIIQQADLLKSTSLILIACMQITTLLYMCSKITKSITWGIAITYGLIIVIVYLPNNIRYEISIIIGLVSCSYFLKFNRVNTGQLIPLLIAAFISCITIVGISKPNYLFDIMAQLHAGELSQDTLFHSSIAAMIKNYGVTSTGLNGLVKTPYHILSHQLYAGISIFSNQSIIEVYAVATAILFAPILILTITSGCYLLNGKRERNLELIWIIASTLLLLLPFLLSNHWALSNVYYTSESYLVSLGLFLAVFPLLFLRNFSYKDIFLIMIMSFLVTSAKGPVGLALFGLFFTRFIFFRGEYLIREISAAGLSFMGFLYIAVGLLPASLNTTSMGLLPFHFMAYTIGREPVMEIGRVLLNGNQFEISVFALAILTIVLVLFFHFIISWIATFLSIQQFGLKNIKNYPIAVYSIVTLIVGIMFISFLKLNSGNAIYFTEFAMFVALPVVVIYSKNIISEKINNLYGLYGLMLLVTILASFNSIVDNFDNSYQYRNYPKNNLVLKLVNIQKNAPLDEVYFFEGNNYTDVPVRINNCEAAPFIFPALSERAWTNVIKTDECSYQQYGYNMYGITQDGILTTISKPNIPNEMKIIQFYN
jgi:hypothetical protein